MEKYKPIQPVLIGVGRDTVSNFARKYTLEISNIYDILNRYNQRKAELDVDSRFWHQVGDKWQYTIPHDGNAVYGVYKQVDNGYQLVYPKVIRDNTNITVEDIAKFNGYILLINDDTEKGLGENVAESILQNLVQWIYGSSENTEDIITNGPPAGESAAELLASIKTLAQQVRSDAQSIKDDFDKKVKTLTATVSNNAVPIGTVLPLACNGTIPEGFLFCDGSAKKKTDYPELFAAIGTLYGGSGDNFNLPDLNNRFIQGGLAGTVREANVRVPDHWHAFGVHTGNNAGRFISQASSATFRVPSVAGTRMWNGNGNGDDFKTDAVQYNLITSYPNTITVSNPLVQPPAITMRYIIKAKTV